MQLIGIGIDTARYGHVASFVSEDLQPATVAFEIEESRRGYEAFRDKLLELRRRDSEVEFRVRIDAAGVYAANLERFLRSLPWRLEISVGFPTVNKNYREIVFPKLKSDKADSLSLARFAIVERPEETAAADPRLFELREAVGRLEGCSRDITRELNRLHNLLSRVLPELELIASDFRARWLLTLLKRFPTPKKVAAARKSSLLKIPKLCEKQATALRETARTSIASLEGPMAELLVRQAADRILQLKQAKTELEKAIQQRTAEISTEARYVTSIPGIGLATAGVLVAKIGDIDRFATAKKLVSFFGVFPEMSSSGKDKTGKPRRPKLMLSRKGNRLARAYLWNAARTAIRCNPDVKALYCRLRKKGTRGDVALGHCMRKPYSGRLRLWDPRLFCGRHASLAFGGWPIARTTVTRTAPRGTGDYPGPLLTFNGTSPGQFELNATDCPENRGRYIRCRVSCIFL